MQLFSLGKLYTVNGFLVVAIFKLLSDILISCLQCFVSLEEVCFW